MVKYVGGLIMESGVYLMDEDAFLDFVDVMMEYYSEEVVSDDK